MYGLLKNGKAIGKFSWENNRVVDCTVELDFQTRDAIAYGLERGHSTVEIDTEKFESKQLTGKPEWN